MCTKTKCDKNNAFQKSRRKVLKGLAAGVGALALPASNASASVWESFFQKHFRDAHVITQHAFLSEARLEAVGQIMFGLEPDWAFFAF